MGSLFTLGNFIKKIQIKPTSLGYFFPHKISYAFILTKNVWGYIWAIFSKSRLVTLLFHAQKTKIEQKRTRVSPENQGDQMSLWKDRTKFCPNLFFVNINA
jgi:hypothetical protein